MQASKAVMFLFFAQKMLRATRVVDFPKDFRSREREFPEISPGIPGNSREL